MKSSKLVALYFLAATGLQCALYLYWNGFIPFSR